MWRAYKVGASDEVNEKINYAYMVSNNKDFVLTLNAENQSWDEHLHSYKKYERGGQLWSDSGICQISRYYHTHIVTDPKWSDWRWQIDQCLKLYKSGTRFYGYDHRHKRGTKIIFNE